MLKIRYFASVREALGQDGEDLPKPDGVHTVGGLIAHLRQQRPAFDKLLSLQEQQGGKQGQQQNDSSQQGPGPILSAVNQTVVSPDHPVEDGDEVAFFPPMTGG